MAEEVLGQFIRYRVRCEEQEMKAYVDEAIMYLTRLGACTACVIKSMDAE